ncbi:MAG: hypothetical protein K5945_08340 [Bacteroidaceae bacterium]|nr:hypothetical protein [Bacteroidaceae bacterium]
MIGILSASCAEPYYLAAPTLQYPIIEDVFSFGVQNMDDSAKIEEKNMVCHYGGFDVKYKIVNGTITFELSNNSNKSLIIDKSKCYVLYDSYATQLFKDVRSTRSTTFNNVQDAINNVQTNEAGVSMTIPPYSKWNLTIEESNLHPINVDRLPAFNPNIGVYALTPYQDNQEVVEFVIPYTYDYSLAAWATCRNRVYVKSVDVHKSFLEWTPTSEYVNDYRRTPTEPLINRADIHWVSESIYTRICSDGLPDYTEANRIDAINRKMFKKHKRRVIGSHTFWTIVGLPIALFAVMIDDEVLGCHHVAPVYGNGQK